MSQTFETLHGLVDKGVKVELGIPYDLWDKPSAEVTQLKTQCETLLERYEDDIEDWYFNRQEDNKLIEFLCRERVLSKKDSECLDEVFVKEEKKGDDGDDEEDQTDKKKSSKTKKEKEEEDKKEEL
jgi:protein canopy 3/4